MPGILHWLRNSREITNFTYDLSPINLQYLIAFVANATGISYEKIKEYADEALNDEQIRKHVRKVTSVHVNSYVADSELKWGRRLAYYVFVRAIKPKVVVETGLDKGLGAIAIAAALIRNRKENFPGYYYGTDIDPEAGYLFTGPYAEYGEILLGDSVNSLANLGCSVDFFIFDSMRTAEYEALEYQAVKSKLSEKAILLTTFAHGSDQLLKFSLATGRRFITFRERPVNHYYPGLDIGIAF
jgi:hypothetical protein